MSLLLKTIPVVPMTRNQRDRAHWAKRRKELEDWTYMIPIAAPDNMQRKEDGPRLVEIVFCKTRGPLSDTDNLYARCKVILDAMQRRGWLYDDSPRYCTLEVREDNRHTEAQTIIAVSESQSQTELKGAA